MKKKLLPIGRQSFRDLRESSSIYVDKTQHIYNLSTQAKMYFLSRPRRFGKSLLLSTLKELFLGSKELFEDTWIVDKWDWTQRNPVIDISFLSVSYEKKGLDEGLRLYQNKIYKLYQIDNQGETDIKILFKKIVCKQNPIDISVIIIEYFLVDQRPAEETGIKSSYRDKMPEPVNVISHFFSSGTNVISSPYICSQISISEI